MFGLSGGELLFIALIALLLFGNEKLPENLKKMFQGLKRVKKVTYEVQKSWQEIKMDVEESLNRPEPKSPHFAVISQNTPLEEERVSFTSPQPVKIEEKQDLLTYQLKKQDPQAGERHQSAPPTRP